MGLPKYYEDFQIGERTMSRVRQLEMADLRIYSACTSLCARIHSDPVYCQNIPELQRITVPYSLVLNVIDGLFAQSISPDGMSTFHYGYDKTEYCHPVYPGDWIQTEFVLIEKTEKNDSFGILTFEATTRNQNQEVVVHHIDKLYVGRRPACKA